MRECNPDANKRSDDDADEQPTDKTVEERLRRLEDDFSIHQKALREVEEDISELEERVDDLETRGGSDG